MLPWRWAVLMERLSHEVLFISGTLKLGKLVAFWIDNGSSIRMVMLKECLQTTHPQTLWSLRLHVIAERRWSTIQWAIKAAIEAASRTSSLLWFAGKKWLVWLTLISLVAMMLSPAGPLGDAEICVLPRLNSWMAFLCYFRKSPLMYILVGMRRRRRAREVEWDAKICSVSSGFSPELGGRIWTSCN